MPAQPDVLRMAWVGFHSEGLLALQDILEAGYHLEALVTLTRAAAARRSASCDYRPLCQRYGVPVHEVENINEPEVVEHLRALHLDLVVVLGWSQILTPEVLSVAKLGVLGAHASLLPRYRGSAPINWAVINGETRAGNSLIWLSEEVDRGGLIDQTSFPITPYDTCSTLYEKVAESNRDMILRLLPQLIAGERPCRPQGRGDPELPRRRPEHGLIDWAWESRRIYDFVRALTDPYPGAFSFLDGERWSIWKCSLLPAGAYPQGEPGELVGPVISPVHSACGQAVACTNGAVVLLEASREGRGIWGPELAEQQWTGKRWRNS